MTEIAIITHYDLSVFRGGEKFVLNLANSLADIGCRVKIYSLPFRRGRIRIENYLSEKVAYFSGFNIRKVEADTSYYIYAPLIYRVFFLDKSPRKIAGIHGFVITPELSDPIVWNLHPLYFLRIHGLIPSLAYHYAKLIGGKELKKFDIVHIINPFQKFSYLIRSFENLVYIPLWTNYSRKNDSGCEENEKFKILMLNVGNFSKGIDISRAIINYFIKKKLRIDFLSNVKALHEKVKFLGFIEEKKMPYILSKVHALLYPARLDTFGMTIIESLNCGTPVITTDIFAHRMFDYPVFRCSRVSDYLKVILNLYKLWEEGQFDIIRNAAIKEGKKFSKEKVFPLYRRLLKC